jgi:capsular polysaccharide biosynthesis protein/Mrp family chromosome partitioning ATPase
MAGIGKTGPPTDGHPIGAPEQPLELRRYLDALGRQRRFILLVVVQVTLAVFLISLLSAKSYLADAGIVALAGPGSAEFSDADAASRRLSTVQALLATPEVLADAARRLPRETAASLDGKVRAAADRGADVVKVIAQDDSAHGAAAIANAATAATLRRDRQLSHAQFVQAQAGLVAARERLNGRPGAGPELAAIRRRLTDLAVSQASAGSDLQVAERARPPSGPVSPRPLRNALLALFGSLFVTVLAALWRDRKRLGHRRVEVAPAPVFEAPPMTAPEPHHGELGARLLQAVVAQRALVAGSIGIALVAGLLLLARGGGDYSASAQVLVTPIPNDRSFAGLQLLRESSEPGRVPRTAAVLVDTPQAARRAAAALGDDWSTAAVARAVSVKARPDDNVVLVTASAGGAGDAARLATAFARGALAARRDAIEADVSRSIAQLQARLSRLRATDPGRAPIEARIHELEGFAATGDPTLSLAQVAQAPVRRSGIPWWLVLGLALLVGAAVGACAALLVETLNRRVRDSDEAQRMYPLPVLARVPRLRTRGRQLSLLALPPRAREALRTLAAQLVARDTDERVVAVTSASTGDGKTTCAAALAIALARDGRRVVLLELDLRRPGLGRLMHMGVADALRLPPEPEARLEDVVAPLPGLPQLLTAPAAWTGRQTDPAQLADALPGWLEEARDLGEFTILDTAALGEIADALPVIALADVTLLVVRPGHTDRAAFELARDLLERSHCVPAGLVVVGEEAAATQDGGPPRPRAPRRLLQDALRR